MLARTRALDVLLLQNDERQRLRDKASDNDAWRQSLHRLGARCITDAEIFISSLSRQLSQMPMTGDKD